MEEISCRPSLYHVIDASGTAVTWHARLPFLSMTMSNSFGGGSIVHLGATKKVISTRWNLYINLYHRELRNGSSLISGLFFSFCLALPLTLIITVPRWKKLFYYRFLQCHFLSHMTSYVHYCAKFYILELQHLNIL